jgi:hypothetical protein
MLSAPRVTLLPEPTHPRASREIRWVADCLVALATQPYLAIGFGFNRAVPLNSDPGFDGRSTAN